MKIKKIEVKNFKAVSEKEIDFNGCSAIITAGNDKGKTSILKGLIERFRGEKPEIIVKEGEENGFNRITLTDGTLIEWKFTEKTESFSIVTKEGIKQTTGVLSGFGEKYFGLKFDIDRFLKSSPKEQSVMLSKITGTDLEEINERYKNEFTKRTEAGRELKRIGSMNLKEPEKVEKPDTETLKKELSDVRSTNSDLKIKWMADNEKHVNEIQEFNSIQSERSVAIRDMNESLEEIDSILPAPFKKMFDFDKAKGYIESMPKPEPKKEIKNLPEPDYLPEQMLINKIDESHEQQRKYDMYEQNLERYQKWVSEVKKARQKYEGLDQNVKSIENEKRELIRNSNLPDEFSFDESGILYKGLPLNDNQVSSSGKYIAALKLGSMVLGEVKTLHFDASFLDKNNLEKIQEWAQKNDLQLLIERPDFEAGEIKYEILAK